MSFPERIDDFLACRIGVVELADVLDKYMEWNGKEIPFDKPHEPLFDLGMSIGNATQNRHCVGGLELVILSQERDKIFGLQHAVVSLFTCR